MEKTIRVLSSSKGKAARRALHSAVSSSEPQLSLLASREVVKTNNVTGMFELVKKFNQLSSEQQNLLAVHVDKLGTPVRMALLNENLEVQENAINVIRHLRPYSVIPQLLRHLELGGVTRHFGVVQWAVNHLLEYFSQEFQRHVPRKTAYNYILTEVIDAMERGLSSWRHHEREIFFDVFFRISERIGTLGHESHEMISNPNHPAYAAFMRKLTGSQDHYVIRFLTRQLEATAVPKGLLHVTSRRTDLAFVRMLLETVGYHPTTMLQTNLSHIFRFDWLGDLHVRLEELDGGCHRFLVEMIHWSGMSEMEKMLVYETVLRFGSRQGKTAVMERLQQNVSPDADRLVLLASDSDNPEIQALALSQLRARRIQGATSKLLRLIDTPHDCVRSVISSELTEFRMDRLLQTLDALSDEQRDYMLRIVKKIDPGYQETIARELENPYQKHKDFLLDQMIVEKTVVTYETSLMKLVENERVLALRLKAVKLLALGIHEASLHFLKNTAERDQDMEVRLLAQRVYEIRNTSRRFTGAAVT